MSFLRGVKDSPLGWIRFGEVSMSYWLEMVEAYCRDENVKEFVKAWAEESGCTWSIDPMV